MRIADDLFRYEGKKSKKLSVKLRYFFFTPGFTFTFFFRKASCSKFLFNKIFWTVCFHFTKFVTGIQIPIGTQIGKGLKIGKRNSHHREQCCNGGKFYSYRPSKYWKRCANSPWGFREF